MIQIGSYHNLITCFTLYVLIRLGGKKFKDRVVELTVEQAYLLSMKM